MKEVNGVAEQHDEPHFETGGPDHRMFACICGCPVCEDPETGLCICPQCDHHVLDEARR